LSVTTVEKCKVGDVDFECEMKSGTKIQMHTISVRICRPHKFSRSVRKKAREIMRKKPYTDSVDFTPDSVTCMLNRSANSLTLAQILNPIANVIEHSGDSSRHSSSPCHIKRRRRTRPAVTQSHQRGSKKSKKRSSKERNHTTWVPQPRVKIALH
jgi:hypothetical protein